MQGTRHFCRLLFGLALALASGRTDTVTLAPAADAALLELQPDFNFGAQEDLPSGRLGNPAAALGSRLLLRFDLAGALPSNAVIRSASLRLTVTRFPDGGGVNSAFGLHRVLRPWAEGTKMGTPPGGAKATAGEATWNARFFPDEHWGKPGGELGVDYVAAATSSERITQNGPYDFEFGQSEIAELMDWLRRPESNFGWMLISELETEPTTARRFGAREHPNVATRPALVIDYTAAPVIAAPRITSISVTPAGAALIRFTAQVSVRYRLEFTGGLPGAPWQAAADYIPSPGNDELTLAAAAAPSVRRFFRVAAIE